MDEIEFRAPKTGVCRVCKQRLPSITIRQDKASLGIGFAKQRLRNRKVLFRGDRIKPNGLMRVTYNAQTC